MRGGEQRERGEHGARMKIGDIEMGGTCCMGGLQGREERGERDQRERGTKRQRKKKEMKVCGVYGRACARRGGGAAVHVCLPD